MKLHLAWVEQEDKDRVEEARRILKRITDHNNDFKFVMRRIDLEVRQEELLDPRSEMCMFLEIG